MPVTAKDIAKHSGVSAATVSMALNNRPGVGEDTRLKILTLARELGYEKQSQKTVSRAKTLNLVIYKKHGDVVSDTPFFSELTQGIEMETRKDSFSLIVSYFYEAHENLKQIKGIVDSSCQGVILLATEMISEDLRRFMPLRLPLVILDNAFDDRDIDSITINNTQGSLLAVKHLQQMGHRQIGHLRSSVGINNFYERRDGYLKGVGNGFDRRYTVPLSSTSEGAYADMKKHLETKPELPTAFFADNDIIALSCIRALREAGCRIPDDVSIIGFDDIPASTLVTPPLTTMRVPKKTLGALAVERLLKRIGGEGAESIRIEVNTALVERSSVKRLQHRINA